MSRPAWEPSESYYGAGILAAFRALVLLKPPKHAVLNTGFGSLDHGVEPAGKGLQSLETSGNAGVRGFGDGAVEGDAGKRRDLGGKLVMGAKAVEAAPHVGAELCPVGGGGNEHGALAAMLLGHLQGDGGVGVEQVVLLGKDFADLA